MAKQFGMWMAAMVGLGVAMPAQAQQAETVGVVAAPDSSKMATARAITLLLLPEGSYANMMETALGPMMDQMMGSVYDMPMAQLAAIGGVSEEELQQIGDTSLADVMEIVDPYWRERRKLQAQAMFSEIGKLMTEMEPGVREAVARVLTREFSEEELTELLAFFQSPTGAKYAATSYRMWMDQEVVKAMTDMMPRMMAMLPDMVAAAEAAAADLPPPRSFSDLSDAEVEKLADVLGISTGDIEDNWTDLPSY